MQPTIFHTYNKAKLHLFLLMLPLSFLVCASAINSSVVERFDNGVTETLSRLRAGPLGAPWLQEAARDVTAFGSITGLSLVTLVAVGFLAALKRFKLAVFVTACVLSVFAASTLLKHLFDRSRPELSGHLTQVFTSSFPSAHATHSAAVYLLLGAVIATNVASRPCKIYIFCVVFSITALVGFSRAYLGVHWPTDIVAGWIAGGFWTLSWCVCADALGRRQVSGGKAA